MALGLVRDQFSLYVFLVDDILTWLSGKISGERCVLKSEKIGMLQRVKYRRRLNIEMGCNCAKIEHYRGL